MEWSYDKKLEEKHYTFRYNPQNTNQSAVLCLIYNKESIEIVNIVPVGISEINIDQYNTILDDFYSEYIANLSTSLKQKLIITKTEDHLNAEDLLSQKALDLLTTFSVAANKSTGSSHPNDFKRWASFLIQVHQDKKQLGTDMLERLLLNLGWPKEKASDLTIEFEFARDLLEIYEDTRQ